MWKRCKRILVGILPFFVLLLAAYLLIFRGFVLRSVVVTGDACITSGEIMRATGLEKGMPLLKMDMDRFREEVDALGTAFLETAEIRFPGMLEVKLKKRRPVAMVMHDGRMLTLDAGMHVVQAHDAVPDADLIYISGMAAREYMLGKLYPAQEIQVRLCGEILQTMLESGAHIYASEIDIQDPNNPVLIARSGLQVHLEGNEEIREKVEVMKIAAADLEHRGESGGEMYLSAKGRADYHPHEQGR